MVRSSVGLVEYHHTLLDHLPSAVTVGAVVRRHRAETPHPSNPAAPLARVETPTLAARDLSDLVQLGFEASGSRRKPIDLVGHFPDLFDPGYSGGFSLIKKQWVSSDRSKC